MRDHYLDVIIYRRNVNERGKYWAPFLLAAPDRIELSTICVLSLSYVQIALPTELRSHVILSLITAYFYNYIYHI